MAKQKKLQWWKMWADFLDDDKIAELNDFECRLFVMAMAFCCRSPYEKWRRGALAITNTMPVTAEHFSRRLRASPAKVQRALLRICEVGAPDSPLLTQEDGFFVLPGWGYRQERDGESPRESPADSPRKSRADPAPEVEVEVEVEKQIAACAFCRKPTRGFVQRYHDEAKAVLGICMSIGRKEIALVKRATTMHGEEQVWGWWCDWLRKPSKIGHGLAVFCSKAVLQRYAEAEAVSQSDPEEGQP